MNKEVNCEVLRVIDKNDSVELIVEDEDTLERFKLVFDSGTDLYDKVEFMTKGDYIKVELAEVCSVVTVKDISWIYDDIVVAKKKVIRGTA